MHVIQFHESHSKFEFNEFFFTFWAVVRVTLLPNWGAFGCIRGRKKSNMLHIRSMQKKLLCKWRKKNETTDICFISKYFWNYQQNPSAFCTKIVLPKCKWNAVLCNLIVYFVNPYEKQQFLFPPFSLASLAFFLVSLSSSSSISK